MPNFLSRLVSRNATNPEPLSLTPYLRSGSPIADFDQRVAIPGFSGVSTDQLNPNHT